ncbi:MAG: phosphate ABC transporter substrate-binding protein [Candidatus Dadabacteria bacterium]|nr:MAG: phosphate ABC transporter substrate-binding protein [Candidatus Dadabacteria bacterium]
MILAVALAAAACSRSTDRTRIVLTGSSTIAPIAEDLARRYESTHPNLRIDVQTGGSTRGILDTRKGLNDIGMVSRALHPDEHDLHATEIALDGLAVIVHRSNPVRNLSLTDLRRIYTGAMTRWSELGGKDLPITVVHKAAGRATQELFLKYTGLADEQIRAQVIIGDNVQGIRTVAATPGAIAYVSIGSAQWEAAHGAAITATAIDGVPATPAAVATGRYPLVRHLNLVTRPSPPPHVRAFLEWATSPETAPIFRSHGVVPVPAARG